MSKNKVVLGFFSVVIIAEMVFINQAFSREMLECETVQVHEKVKAWIASGGREGLASNQLTGDLITESLSRKGVYVVLTPQTLGENGEFSRYKTGDKLLVCDNKDRRLVLKK